MSQVVTQDIFRAAVAVCALLAAAGTGLPGRADTILASKHDLSVAGPGPIKATSESDVCLFCHTPHRGTGELPLWNHALSQATYTPYSSSTAKASIGQPTGASKLCLSCHDGTVALGMVASRSTAIQMQSGVTTMPPGPANLGTDLADDHPISFVFNSGLATSHGQMRDPATLNQQVRLDDKGEMQCTACHDPHDNQFGKFLVMNNRASALCLQCHDPLYWSQSAHMTSPKTWDGSGLNPWPHTTETTVAANACENCHAPHNAGTKPRLLTWPLEEQNCYSCHTGTVATKNIETDFQKISVHPILSTSGVHDPLEDPMTAPRHVECVDCHNPHAARVQGAIAPQASGALAGVKGISSSGAIVNPVQNEYELCYRCHADSPNRGRSLVNRQYPETNTRNEFQSVNASYHPVQSPGRNTSVPSLLAPWTTSSRMYCTDCHNGDQGPGAGGTGANGPHGSIFRPILERQLVLTDFGAESSGAYALCYKCHSRSSILANDSFPYHRLHVEAQQTACTTCHDSHGMANVPHLVNFNVDYVSASSNGKLEYKSLGPRRGACSLSCHGQDHKNLGYTPVSGIRNPLPH